MSVRFLATCFIHSPLGSDVIPPMHTHDIDDKQDMVADEPERVHNLDGEQVCRSDGAPMSLDEGAPRHAPAPLRRRSDTVLGKEPLDGVASEFMS